MLLYLIYRNYKIDDCGLDYPPPTLVEICLSKETAYKVLLETKENNLGMDCWIYPREAKP